MAEDESMNELEELRRERDECRHEMARCTLAIVRDAPHVPPGGTLSQRVVDAIARARRAGAEAMKAAAVAEVMGTPPVRFTLNSDRADLADAIAALPVEPTDA